MHMRIRRGIAAALTVSALGFTSVACGGASDKKSDSSTEKGGSSASEKPAEDKKVSTEPLTAEQMKASTLELGDLPSGWSVRKIPSSNDPAPKADKPECQPIADMMGVVKATKGDEIDFVQADGKIELDQRVFTFPGTGAADYVKAVDTALATCTTVSFDMEGTKVPVKIARVDAPKAAEASQAFTMAMAFAPGIEIKVHMLVAHQGTGATRAVYKSADAAEAQKTFGDLVTRIGDKLVKGATS
ncbi:hypothetical protein [Streptomyces sp. NPDC018833]|uniref:hypothetical protein n=1 Tax=Streptomyces sp. NPDC018833 TaxID=3365053 RepID=UPI00379DC97E